MEREQVMHMLENYRQCQARCECLRMEIGQAERQLARERAHALANAVLPGHDLAAMPGGGVGDPTAGVATRFASGYQPRFLRQMASDLDRLRDELRECEDVCRFVEAWRKALSDRERLVIDLHVIDGATYAEVLDAFSRQFPAAPVTSPDGMKCLNRRAIEKICRVAGA